MRKILRSDLSGRIINGRSVIMVSEVIEYVKKMGYIIIEPIKRKSNLQKFLEYPFDAAMEVLQND